MTAQSQVAVGDCHRGVIQDGNCASSAVDYTSVFLIDSHRHQLIAAVEAADEHRGEFSQGVFPAVDKHRELELSIILPFGDVEVDHLLSEVVGEALADLRDWQGVAVHDAGRSGSRIDRVRLGVRREHHERVGLGSGEYELVGSGIG